MLNQDAPGRDLMNSLQQVIQFVGEHYTLTTLPELCIALRVREDDLGDNRISVKARALVLRMGEEGRFADLLAALEAQRPAAFRTAGLSNDDVLSANLSQEWATISKLKGQQVGRAGHPWQLLPRPEAFTGRETELAKLMADLQPGKIAALTGPGGMGKTALAAQALHHLNDSGELAVRFPDGVIVHDFYASPQAVVALEHIARSFDEKPEPGPAEAARRVLSGRRLLLVLDGTENADDLKEVLAVRGGCGVLITSQKRADAPVAVERQDMKPLPPEKSVELLQRWAGQWAADRQAVDQICKLVGSLPLAVCLIGQYLEHHEFESTDYLTWLQSSTLAALNFEVRQRQSVPLVLERSVARLSEEARQALAVIGVLALAPFGRKVVAAGMGVEEVSAGRYLGELVNSGLLMRLEEERRPYQVTHTLVYAYARERMGGTAEIVGRLGSHYTVLAAEQSKLGLAGYKRLDKDWLHILSAIEKLNLGRQLLPVCKLILATVKYMDVQSSRPEQIAVLRMGLQAAQACFNRFYEASFSTHLANTYAELGQVEKAIPYYEAALKIARETNNLFGEEASLGNLGRSFVDLGQTAQGIIYYEQALTIARNIGDQNGESIGLGNLGNAYAHLGETQKAIDYLEQALSRAHELKNRDSVSTWLASLGHIYTSTGESEKAIKYFEQALEIGKDLGLPRVQAANWNNIAEVYRELGDLEKAIECFSYSLEAARTVSDQDEVVNRYNDLGMLYRELERVDEAINCHEQAVITAQANDYKQGESNALTHLGVAYLQYGEVEKAITSFKRALEIDQSVNDQRGAGINFFNLGHIYASLGEAKQAINYFEQALKLDREVGGRDAEATTLLGLGIIYDTIGQVEQAKSYLRQAVLIFEELSLPLAEKAREALEGLSR